MRKNNKNTGNRKYRLFPKKNSLKLLVLVNLLVTAFFMVMMTLVDAFPRKLTVIILILVVIVMILTWRLMCSRKKHTKRRVTGVVISVIYIIILLSASYFLIETFSMFNRITTVRSQFEQFYVIAPKDTEYEPEQIEGKKVFVVNTIDETYTEAENILKEEKSVKYEELHTTTGIMKRIIGEKKKPTNLAYVSSAVYSLLCDEYDDFEDNSKILYTVQVEMKNADLAKRTNVTKEPFNIYISGIDVFGDIGQVSRSDVNMLVTVNPVTKQILLTSIPRDSYVTLHSYGQPDKLTHSGIYGIDETINTVQDWLGVDINYYLRVNFTTLVDVVNAIGGIDVYSPVAFKSAIQDYSYVKGMNHLDGREALYFARERKSFKTQDEARNKNQQRVMKAILKKLLSSTTLLTKYDVLIAAVQDKIETNMTTDEISSLVKMQLNGLASWDIITSNITGDDAMAGTYSMGMSRELYVKITSEESVTAAIEKIDQVMNPTEEDIAEIEAKRAEERAEKSKNMSIKDRVIQFFVGLLT